MPKRAGNELVEQIQSYTFKFICENYLKNKNILLALEIIIPPKNLIYKRFYNYLSTK